MIIAESEQSQARAARQARDGTARRHCIQRLVTPVALAAIAAIAVALAMIRAGAAGCALRGRFDVVIRGGLIVDGSGGEPYRGDVLVCGDRIARVVIGSEEVAATRVINATGLVVAPGFIDMLGQSEYTILSHPDGSSKLLQGITTEITGEVESVWPRPRGEASGTVPWTSLDGYLRLLETRQVGLNLGTLVTAGSVWRAEMGDDTAVPTTSQREAMEKLVDRAMREGAFGLSAALLYAPASRMTTAELTDLARAAARHHGIYATHLRSESDSVEKAVLEALYIGRVAHLPVQIHHLKVAGARNWGRMRSVIGLIDSARASGQAVGADMYPYTTSNTNLAVLIPDWAAGWGNTSLRARLSDARIRARVDSELVESGLRPSAMRVVGTQSNRLSAVVGWTVADIAAARKESWGSVVVDLVREDSSGPSMLFASMQERDVELVMQQRWVSFGVDAGVAVSSEEPWGSHPRGFGTMPRILGVYVRDKRLLSLQESVRKMTSLAAMQAGLTDRGMLVPGLAADITVFDPAAIVDVATEEYPRRFARGIEYVVVNGTLAVDHEEVTDERAGRGLRSSSYDRTFALWQRALEAMTHRGARSELWPM